MKPGTHEYRCGCAGALMMAALALCMGIIGCNDTAYEGQIHADFAGVPLDYGRSDHDGQIRVSLRMRTDGRFAVDYFEGMLPMMADIGTVHASVDLLLNKVTGQVAIPAGERHPLADDFPDLSVARTADSSGFAIAAEQDGLSYEYRLEMSDLAFADDSRQLSGRVRFARAIRVTGGPEVLVDEFEGSFNGTSFDYQKAKPLPPAPPLLTVDAGDHQTMTAGDRVTLSPYVEADGDYDVQWTPTTGLDDPTALNPHASPDATTGYTVRVTTPDGRWAEDSVTVAVEPLEDGSIGVIKGYVQDVDTGEPLSGALVRIDLEKGSASAKAGADGSYRIPVPDVPEFFALIVTLDGYVPFASGVSRADIEGGRVIDMPVGMALLTEADAPMELLPTVHHLGDDSFSGTINSRFIKRAEGIEYTTAFDLTTAQLSAYTQATLSWTAKGTQEDNDIEINGHRVGDFCCSPLDGNFGEQDAIVPAGILHQGRNQLTVRSLPNPTNAADRDDFEFVNILLKLSVNDVASDDDIDDDGVTNALDDDVDGDGLTNGMDGDIDGDGAVNSADDDMDGDGVRNALDDDPDGTSGQTGGGSNPHDECVECVLTYPYGWCDGACVLGNSSGPFSGSCHLWVWAPQDCPVN